MALWHKGHWSSPSRVARGDSKTATAGQAYRLEDCRPRHVLPPRLALGSGRLPCLDPETWMHLAELRVFTSRAKNAKGSGCSQNQAAKGDEKITAL